jgi:hypothetical protein
VGDVHTSIVPNQGDQLERLLRGFDLDGFKDLSLLRLNMLVVDGKIVKRRQHLVTLLYPAFYVIPG